MPQDDLIPEPLVRKLRIFAFDPRVASQTDTVEIGESTISIRWGKDLKPGPVGEDLEGVDAYQIFA